MKFHIHETYHRGKHLWAYTVDKEGAALCGSLDSASKVPIKWTHFIETELDGDGGKNLLKLIQKNGGLHIGDAIKLERMNEEIEESLMAQKADMERNILERVQAQAAKMGVKVTGFTIKDIAVGEPTEERNSIRRVIDLILRRK